MTLIKKLWCYLFHRRYHENINMHEMQFNFCNKLGCINCTMKRFLLCNVRQNGNKPYLYLHTEVIYASRLCGYFSGLHWLKDAKWQDFIENAEVGDYAIFGGVFSVTRIKDKIEND